MDMPKLEEGEDELRMVEEVKEEKEKKDEGEKGGDIGGGERRKGKEE